MWQRGQRIDSWSAIGLVTYPIVIAPLPPRPSATAVAEHALRAAIVSGELVPGDRLPPERELAATLGVSRLTLRAALATLSAAGLIDVRHGSGYTVRDLRASGGTDLLPSLLAAARSASSNRTARGTRGGGPARLDAALADLLRLRRHLAGAVLEALVERPPPAAARRAFTAAVAGFAAAAETGDIERIAEADLAVVRALLDATGSLVLRVCLNPIVATVRGDANLRGAIYAAPETNLAGWRALEIWLERPTATALPGLLGVLAERDRTSLARLARPPRKRTR
jgi:DNA-binding FadR family transcriptional regulator